MLNIKKIVSSTIETGIRGVLIGTMSTIMILLILFVSIILFPTIKLVLPVTEENIALMNISLTVVFVFVTSVYVYFTARIVEQSSIERKVTSIEKSLELFYYPLQSALQLSDCYDDNMEIDEFDPHDRIETIFINMKSKVEKLIPYQYLAKSKVKEDFLKLDKFAKKDSRHLYENLADIEKVIDDLKANVNKDIEMYISELNKLIERKEN